MSTHPNFRSIMNVVPEKWCSFEEECINPKFYCSVLNSLLCMAYLRS